MRHQRTLIKASKMRPIRRVRSPSRPRAWISSHYKPKSGERLHRPRDEHSSYSPSYGRPTYYHHRRDHFKSSRRHLAPREREGEDEKVPHVQRECPGGDSPPEQNSSSRDFLPRSPSSRDKDMHSGISSQAQNTPCFSSSDIQSGQSNGNQSRERDYMGTKRKEKEGELPSAVGQMAARDRAIRQKRREIDEVYYQECEMFGFVAKMLIAKDPSLEHSIQYSLQQNLRDIGKRCVEAMEKFIEDYDTQESSE